MCADDWFDGDLKCPYVLFGFILFPSEFWLKFSGYAFELGKEDGLWVKLKGEKYQEMREMRHIENSRKLYLLAK